MPMRYANQTDVLAQLEMGDDDARLDRLVRLENGLADTFDQKIGRSFGVAPEAETRLIGQAQTGPRLILPVAIRSVTTVETNGSWDGASWADSTVVDAADYRLALREGGDDRWWAIDSLAGAWPAIVRITGVWDDQPQATVPDDVREALTFITCDEWRTRNASPAGEIGPEGLVIPVRNPWRFEAVQAAIERHRLVRLVV